MDQIAAFEADLFEYISTNEPDIFTRIREEKVIADDVEEMLVKAIEATKAKSKEN